MQAIVKTILDRVLGPYCDFEGDINVDMWSGKAVLRHVRIKPDVIGSLGIPVDIKSAFIDRIGLVCDWRSGFNKPVEVELSHVYAVISPRSDFSKLDLEKIKKDALQSKRDKKSAQLKAWEDAQFDPEKGFVGRLGKRLLQIQPRSRKQSIKEAAEDIAPENMTRLEKLIAKIMANLRIKVSHVHVRLEAQDNAIGVKIREFSVQTTDGLFKPSFVTDLRDVLFKSIALEEFLIYANSGASIRSRMEKQNLAKDEAPASEPQFRYILRTELEEDNTDFLLNPVSFTIHVTMQQHPTEKIPKIKIDAYMNNIKLVLTNYQYRSVFKVQEAMTNSSEILNKLIGPEIYAGDNFESNLVDIDREYVELYRRTLHVSGLNLPDLAKDEEARLLTLELYHTTDEIEFYRKSVLNELDEYLVRRSSQLKYEILRKRDVPRESGWFSWFKSPKLESTSYEGLLPTESEIDTVLESHIIEEQEEKALLTIFSEVSFRIPEISLTLVGDKGKLLRGSIFGSTFKATMLNMSTTDIEMTIFKVSLLNLLSEQAAFPEILYPSSTDTDEKTSLLHLLIRVNPIDLPAKFAVFGGIEPVDVVVDYILIQNVLPFFSYESEVHKEIQPQIQPGESLSIISTLAASTPKDVVLARRPSIIVELKISAPTILVPQKPLEKDTLLLVIDLGCFFISTRPASKNDVEVDLTTINVSDITDVENPIYKRFYDNFSLEYKNLQIFLSEHGKDWRSYHDPESTESKLLCPVSSFLFIGLCVLVDSGPLASLVVNVSFKPLSVQISANDLKQLMVISTGFQLVVQDQSSSPDTELESTAVRTKSQSATMSKDQMIPSDLTVKLSGRETDVDAFINVFLEGLNVAISVDSLTILNAAIDGIALNLTRRTFDTAVSFSIHDMYVEECLSKTKLIRSYLSTASTMSADSDLRQFIYCRYLQKDQTSPSFQEVDHFLEIFVGLLELSLEPTSLYETALFIKNLLDAVILPPHVVEGIEPIFEQGYLSKRESATEARPNAAPITILSIHQKFDGILLRTLIQNNIVMEASIREVQCDITQDIGGCIKACLKLDSLRIEDCLVPNGSVFRHIVVSAEELPQLFVLEVEYSQDRLNVNCKVDAITLLCRFAFLAELLDLIQFSPISRIPSVFVQAPSENVQEEIASNASEAPENASELKPGRVDLEVGQLQLQLAPNDTLDRLFIISVKSAVAHTERSEITAEFHELQAVISASSETLQPTTITNIISISWFKVTYDASSNELQSEQNAFVVTLDSSPLSLLAGTKEYVSLLETYNNCIAVKPSIVREAYHVEVPTVLPAMQKSIAAVMPAIYLTVNKVESKMLKRNNGIDLILELNGKFQASLQSIAGEKDSVVLGSGFSFTFDKNASEAWSVFASIDAICISRIQGNVTMSILRPTNVFLNMSSIPMIGSNYALNVNIEADQLHFAISYSSILLCRNSAMILMQALNPVLDSLGKKDLDSIESGDAFPVPMKVDIPACFDGNEMIPAWNLNESFNISLKSIRLDIANDIVTSASARRVPVLELLILLDPKSEGHGYGNVRHMYLGLLVSAKVYNNKVSAWEPFIEPTSITIMSRQTASLQELNIAFSDRFDINISDLMLASFMDSYRLFTAALSAPIALGNAELTSLTRSSYVEANYMVQAKNELEIPVNLSFIVGDQIREASIGQYSTDTLPLLDESVKLQLSVGDDWLPIKNISISRTGAQSFWVLGNKADNKNNSVRIIIEIDDTGSSKLLLIHSDRQIQNHASIDVNVTGFDIKPTQALWLPAFSYDPSSILSVSVAGSSAKSSLDFSKEKSWLMFNTQENGIPLCLQAERYQILCNAYAIHLKPTRVIQNLLPVPCRFFSTIRNRSWQDDSPLISPSNEHSLMIDPNEEVQFQIMLPFMESWSSPVSVYRDSKQIITVRDRQQNKLKMDMEVQADKIIIFVGYWIYDLVQLPGNIQLQISSEQFENVPAAFTAAELSMKSGELESLIEPLMFCSDSGKACLRLSWPNSQFSRPFSIQAAGSSEVVTVIVDGEAYQFNVNTSLCMAPFTRTKMVVLTPRYIIVNSLHFPIVFKQFGDTSELRLESGKTQPFYKWPINNLPEKLCFKRDKADAVWTDPVAVSEITDDTLALKGMNWTRLARLEVQRGNSTFLMLSHQKPCLVPLVVLNRTIACDVWIRQKGHLNWHHLSPETGYPFGVCHGSQRDLISFKLGWLGTSGAQIVRRIDLDLVSLKDKQSVFPWNDANSHDIVFELEQRGPFRSVIISERIRDREALCASVSSIHSKANDLVSQWTTKKIELTELIEHGAVADRYLHLNIIECSHLDVPSSAQSVYLIAAVFEQTVQTPAVADITDPYFESKFNFAVDKDIHEGVITICLYTIRASNLSTLFCKFDVPIDFNVPVADRWFNIEIQSHSVGQIHLSMRIFQSKSELLKYEMQGINAALLKHHDVMKELDLLIESFPVTVQERSDLVVTDPNQKTRLLEFQIFPIEVRGADVPRPERKSLSFPPLEPISSELTTPSAHSSSPRFSSTSRRIICEFKANIPGPDKGSHSAVVLTDWNGEQVARVLKESFSFRLLSDANYSADVFVEITLKQEHREGQSSAQYRVLDRLVISISKTLSETWMKFESGKNEICLTILQSNIVLSQQDLIKSISQIQLFCNQIGISLIDRMSREIMYISILSTYLNMLNTSDQLGVSIYIGSLQFDNQMHEALYPVAFIPKKIIDNDGKSIPWLQAAVFNLKDKQNEGFIHLQYLSLLLQETNFFVEEEIIWALYEFITGMADTFKPLEPVSERCLGLSISEYRAHPEPGATTNIYIKTFVLHPIALNLTFQPDLTRREQKRLRLVSRYPNPIDMLLGAAGVTLGAIKEAPFRIDSLEIFDLFGSWETLISPIKKHYLIQILQQAYKLLGSLSVLGNPIGLVSNLGQGVKHLFYDPAQGLVSSPLDFGKGLATGSKRFVQHTVGGVLSSAGQITSSLGTGVAVLTMDRSYLEKREKDERKRIIEAAQGTESHNVATGLMAFGSGLIGGIRGAVEKPVAGLKKGGALGFLKGIMKGGAALIAQPIVGVIDLGTHTVQGIQGVIGKPSGFYGVSRCRLPRFITRSGILERYNILSSKGQSILWASSKLLENISIPLTAQQREQESLISCKEIRIIANGNIFKSVDIALTSFRIVGAEFDSDSNPPASILFSIGLDQIDSVSHVPTDDRFILQLTDGTKVPIKTRSPSEADDFLVWIIQHLEDCVPIIHNATYGTGNCWITITELLQEHISTMRQAPVVTADQIEQMIRHQDKDFIASCGRGRLWVEYTRGPDLISSEFNLTQPVAF